MAVGVGEPRGFYTGRHSRSTLLSITRTAMGTPPTLPYPPYPTRPTRAGVLPSLQTIRQANMGKPSADKSGAATRKRRYHSPLRQQQSEKTRFRIIDAGAALVHSFHAWNWTNL